MKTHLTKTKRKNFNSTTNNTPRLQTLQIHSTTCRNLEVHESALVTGKWSSDPTTPKHYPLHTHTHTIDYLTGYAIVDKTRHKLHNRYTTHATQTQPSNMHTHISLSTHTHIELAPQITWTTKGFSFTTIPFRRKITYKAFEKLEP